MKKFAIYTLGFFLPLAAYVAYTNWQPNRFEARTAGGWIYVVDLRSGEVTSCLRRECQTIKSGEAAPASSPLDLSGLRPLEADAR